MKLMICLAIIMVAGASVAQIGDSYPVDGIGFVVDLESSVQDWPCYPVNSPMTHVTLHLVITNPSAGSVSGWHTGMLDPVGAVAVSTTLTAGSDLTPDDAWDVTIGVGPSALPQNAAGLVHIADLRFVVEWTPTIVEVFVLPHPTLAGGHAFSYTGPADLTTNIPLTRVVGDSGTADFLIKSECGGLPAEQKSWSSIKSLYR